MTAPYDSSSPVPPAAPQAPYQPEPKTNTLAIVGFVLSFLLNIVGAIISLVALSQIKKSGEKGRGLAIAGAIIGFIGFVLSIIWFVLTFVVIAQAVNQAEQEYERAQASVSAAADAWASEASSEVSALADDLASALPSGSLQELQDKAAALPDNYCSALGSFYTWGEETEPVDETYLTQLKERLTQIRDASASEETKQKLTQILESLDQGNLEGFEEAMLGIASQMDGDYSLCSLK